MTKIVKRQLEMPTLLVRDFNGVEMGVLTDGTPYLTGRGLAALCGVAPSVVNEWAGEYDPDSTKPRDVAITRLIENYKYEGELYFSTVNESGQRVNAFPDKVSAAILEYYAFEAADKKDKALQTYRALTRGGLRAFIYAALGYEPSKADPFRSYHARLSLNVVPKGLFNCFSESAGLVLAAIQAGLVVDDHTIPDISVGRCWSDYWTKNKLEAKYGQRSKQPHNFPSDYPQLQTVEAYAYPLAALGEFRIWMDNEYLPNKYPAYLQTKVKTGKIAGPEAAKLLAAMNPPQLPSGQPQPPP